MIVVDSSGWLEYFGKGENGEHFVSIIQNSAELLVPVICLYEVFKRVMLQQGEEAALQAAGIMTTGKIIDVTLDVAVFAAQLSVEHKLPMADSLILAVARLNDADLWTQDEHFRGLERVNFIAKQ